MNTATSLLGLLFDHTIGNILRMLAVIRLPKLERGPVSHGFVATLIVIMGYGLVMLFSASYSSGYANYGMSTTLSARRASLRCWALWQCSSSQTSTIAPCDI